MTREQKSSSSSSSSNSSISGPEERNKIKYKSLGINTDESKSVSCTVRMNALSSLFVYSTLQVDVIVFVTCIEDRNTRMVCHHKSDI